MPLRMVRVYHANITRIQAQEAMVAVNVAIAGNPNTLPNVRRKIIKPWEDLLEKGRPTPQVTPDQQRARLQMAGIKVRQR